MQFPSGLVQVGDGWMVWDALQASAYKLSNLEVLDLQSILVALIADM